MNDEEKPVSELALAESVSGHRGVLLKALCA